ncbi:diaminopimelate decarboxylase [Vulcanibacillus modesticaldus]|uniref:Diaminopimelate decarboxylase n=1 Tax=Vulcanibacillus modesticaldus TaxID=337097 RepID=A0A1D2YSF0_9BACI|nr:diaminopimelate decarboxylase [Vulcanibacillus modesticaldus]OEF97245.1 diaminopimelate decarboxylase [Vulcanibacillus modesticaldus]
MYLSGTKRINEKNHLEIGGVDTTDLVKHFGTPLYVLDEFEIRNKMREFINTFKSFGIPFQVAYASKALCTMAICYLVEDEGLSLDVVSGGELFTAIEAGFPTNRIHFHGNNKSVAEITMAIEAEIGAFIVDNLYEIELIESIAENKQKRVNALIRVTPGIEAHTHEYIQTGQEDSKFGFNLVDAAYNAAKLVHQSKWINLLGFHFHIGSQIFDMKGFEKAIERMAGFYRFIHDELDVELPIINAGGGFGIHYVEEDEPLSIREYVVSLVESFKYHFYKQGLKLPEIWIEPGRSIIGEAGTTLYTIGSSKNIPNIRKYIAVDGGMMDNPRTALYQAKYDAAIANRMIYDQSEVVSVAGKACESGDMLIWDIELNSPVAGDILAVFSTGAYNYSMASNYNRIPRPAMVLVNEGEAELIVRRETYSDIIQFDVVPERLKKNKVKILG